MILASLVGGLVFAAASAATAAAAPRDTKPAPFRYMLNTSTIRGQNLTLDEEVAIAA